MCHFTACRCTGVLMHPANIASNAAPAASPHAVSKSTLPVCCSSSTQGSCGRGTHLPTQPAPCQGGERHKEEEVREDVYPSVVPFLPPLTDATIKDYWTFYLGAVAAIITFGALLAPALELHLGMGGTLGCLLGHMRSRPLDGLAGCRAINMEQAGPPQLCCQGCAWLPEQASAAVHPLALEQEQQASPEKRAAPLWLCHASVRCAHVDDRQL